MMAQTSAWARGDVWAMLTIVDRDFAQWFRAQALVCAIIGVLTFLGLNLLTLLGVPGIRFTLLFAAIAFVMEFIPYVGSLLGSLPAILFGFAQGWETGLAVTALYIVIQQVEGNLLAPRILSEAAAIHPAVMTPAMLALSQVGGLAVILAAPLTAVLRDLFVYVYGRLREPPEPAGWSLAPAPEPAARGDEAAEISRDRAAGMPTVTPPAQGQRIMATADVAPGAGGSFLARERGAP